MTAKLFFPRVPGQTEPRASFGADQGEHLPGVGLFGGKVDDRHVGTLADLCNGLAHLDSPDSFVDPARETSFGPRKPY